MLYSEENNLNWAYDVIQNLSRSKEESQILAQFYADLNKLFEVKKIFPITGDVKEMHERWNKLIVLVFLGALHPEFLKARSNVIVNSIVEPLEDTYHFLCGAVLSESYNPVSRSLIIDLLLRSKTKQ